MRLNVRAFSITAAIVAASAYLLGALVHVASPWGAPAVASYLYRVDVIELAQPLTLDSFIAGVLVFAAGGALFGGLTAWLYNRLTPSQS